jgi:hypothetical protein
MNTVHKHGGTVKGGRGMAADVAWEERFDADRGWAGLDRVSDSHDACVIHLTDCFHVARDGSAI